MGTGSQPLSPTRQQESNCKQESVWVILVSRKPPEQPSPLLPVTRNMECLRWGHQLLVPSEQSAFSTKCSGMGHIHQSDSRISRVLQHYSDTELSWRTWGERTALGEEGELPVVGKGEDREGFCLIPRLPQNQPDATLGLVGLWCFPSHFENHICGLL